MKTSDLTGPDLDWAVAKCENEAVLICGSDIRSIWTNSLDPEELVYSTDWSQGGPIMEREKINVEWWGMDWWHAWIDSKADLPPIYNKRGPTPLIAAMRCYVASKLGDEVDVPNFLIKGEK